MRDNAKAHPEKPALVCDGQTVSWGAFDQRINKIANLLLSMGVSKGDNIAIEGAFEELKMGNKSHALSTPCPRLPHAPKACVLSSKPKDRRSRQAWA